MQSILDKITRVWRLKDLRNSILFVLGMLAIFRLAAHIPIPGIDLENLRMFFRGGYGRGALHYRFHYFSASWYGYSAA
jgi:preprotein translocase subunit SecY